MKLAVESAGAEKPAVNSSSLKDLEPKIAAKAI
jgi:hypothetical protein